MAIFINNNNKAVEMGVNLNIHNSW
jgi:hypothetical protein